MLLGYTGRVLRINLSEGTSKIEALNKEWAAAYFGGKGLGMKYIFEELAPGTDPLSPSNKIVMMTAPFTGTVVPCSGKLSIVTKSPATGTILESSIGGNIAGEIKFAGYDAIVIEGRAVEPSYIHIKDEITEIKSAKELWGKGSHETEISLREQGGREAQVLSIGPAGENLLPNACINGELYRQAGRGGVGAVMGSKNIKAIVVTGTGEIKVADINGLMEKVSNLMRNDLLTDTNLWASEDGTAMLVDLSQSVGILPTRNFQDGTFKYHNKINSDEMKLHRVAKKACLSCGLGCGNYTRIGEAAVEGPEYETLAVGGSNCGISDLQAVVKFNAICDDLGMDTISTGGAIAFAMELTEKGIYDFGLRFGDVDAYLKVVEMIGRSEGIGIELGRGVRYLAECYGGKEFAMEVKGLEFPGYDPRGCWGMGLAYATSDRGACHMRAWPVADEAYGDVDPFTAEGKAQLVINAQHHNATKFSTILCDFWAVSLDNVAEMLSLVLGKQVTAAQLELAGERIYNLSRLFNNREGFSRKDDYLPKRLLQDNLLTGRAAGKHIPPEVFETMLNDYYALRDWDEGGNPKKFKIDELKI